MRLLAHFAIIATIAITTLAACETPSELAISGSWSLPKTLGFPEGGNTVKLYAIAYDPASRRVFVQGILTPELAVVDLDARKVVAYLDTGISGYHLSHLAVDSGRSRLFVADQGTLKLMAFDSRTLEKKGEIELPYSPTRMAASSEAGLLAVSFSAHDEIRFYSTEDLDESQVLTANDGVYGPQGIKDTDGVFYVAQGRDTLATDPTPTHASVLVVDARSRAATLYSLPVRGAEKVAADPAAAALYALSSTSSSGVLRWRHGDGTTGSFSLGGGEQMDVFFDSSRTKLYVLTRDGLDSTADRVPWGSLDVIDPATGGRIDRIRLGAKSSHGVLSEDGRWFFASNMADGTLSVVDLEDRSVVNVDVGASIEDTAAAPGNDDDRVLLLSRLGGSELHLFDRSEERVTKTVATRPWPCRILSDSGRGELLILSHFASMIEVRDATSLELKREVDLTLSSGDLPGLSQNRTHFIPSFAYDADRSLAYASFPEQGRLISANVSDATGGSGLLAAVEAFDPVSEEDPDLVEVGREQLAVDPLSGAVYLLHRQDWALEVRATRTLELLQELTLNADEYSGNAFAADLLFFDAQARALYVGGSAFSAANDGTLSSRAPARSRSSALDFVFGTTPEGGGIWGAAYVRDSEYSISHGDSLSGEVQIVTSLTPKFRPSGAGNGVWASTMGEGELNWIASVGYLPQW